MSARRAPYWRLAPALLALLVAACSGGESNGTAPPPTLNAEPLVLRISPKVDTLAVGATRVMSASLTTLTGAPRSAPIAWSSADPSVASIADGQVTAVAYGRTTIHARAGSASDSATVVVTSDQLQLVVSPSAVSATAGDTIEFHVASLAGSSALAKTSGVTWYISDTTSAELSEGGALATRAEGEVTVTAAVGSSTASATVKISNAPVTSISISPSTSSISVGDTTRLRATLLDSRGRVAKGSLSWSSSSASIATVDSDGRVKAVAKGGAVITAKSGKYSASATVNVSSSPATSVTLAFADSLAVSRTVQATATARDASGAVVLGRPMAWQSSNPGVATVTNTGLLTGIAGGQSNISVIVDGIVATKKLTVIPSVPSSVVISPSAVNVVVGSSTMLAAEVRDQYGNKLTGQTVTWTSDAPATASVSGGKVTGLALGGAGIRASVGTLSGRASVSVQNVPVASVALSPSAASVEEGKSVTLVATARDASGNVLANRPATFTSSAPQLATVNAAGEVTGVAPGSLTITATVEGVQATSAITVTGLPPAPVASITYTLNSNTLDAGQTTQGVARTFDANGKELFGRPVAFVSLNPSIASVDANGTVTALAGGTASLSATSEGKVGYTSVTVNPSVAPVASVSVTAPTTSMDVGDTTSLNVVLEDAAGNTLVGRTVSFTTSNPAVVSVSSSGLVTGAGAGSATVTATSGGISGSLAFAVASRTTPLAPVATVAVTLNASTLTVGQGTQGTVVLRDASNNVLTGRSITWSSSNPAVATVSQAGYVIAASAGSATISVSSEGKTGSAPLTVNAPVAKVATVSVALGLSTITVGQSTTATATARDASGNVVTGSSVSWSVTPSSGVASASSSTSSTITVSGSGAGTVSVVASIGGVTGSVSLTVKSATATPIATPAAPALLNFTKPAVTGQQWIVNAGGNLQTALNNAQRGDEIVLQAGASFVGNFILPKKTGTSANGWITIRSSQLGSLPAGTRVGPAQASMMPKILSPNADGALKTAAGTSGWWIAGVEFGLTSASYVNYGIVLMGDGTGAQNSVSLIPSDLVLDRVYIHASATQPTSRCLAFNSARTEVRDSYLYDCHGKGFDTQAIGGWNGPGPYRIYNNMLAGAGENVMFGGANPAIYGLVPADIEIRRNYLYTPRSWEGVWTKKNIFELKNSVRVLVEGNVLDGSWVDGQVGFAVMIYSTNQGSTTCYWCRVSDVTMRNNLIRNVTQGINLSGGQTAVDSVTRRIALVSNVIDSLKGAGDGRLVQLLSRGQDLTIDSLVAMGGGGRVNQFLVLDPNPAWINFSFTNSVVALGTYGMFSSYYPQGETALNAIAGSKTYNNVWIVGAARSNYPTSTFVSSESQAPMAAAIRARVAAATAGVAIP